MKISINKEQNIKTFFFSEESFKDTEKCLAYVHSQSSSRFTQRPVGFR